MRLAVFLVGCAVSVPGLAQQQSSDGRCAALSSLVLESAKVSAAELLPAGAGVPGAKLCPRLLKELPAFCRVMVADQPSSDSMILTEVWLPVLGLNGKGWNGRFRGQGNGGFAGTIAFSEMAAAVAEGYATAGTDTGHVGGTSDFALGHPEKVKDFGWRAVHDMTVQAKALAAAFYGKGPTHSYFAACSDGGREALMEAQRFPTDYDGIVAGAPAYHWTALVSGGAEDTKAMLASPSSYLPASKIALIASAVKDKCDRLDGVSDGILNDPRACNFDPAALACKGSDSSSCLLPEQVATLKTIYAAKRDAAGKVVYPGLLPGAEEGPGGWVSWITGGGPGKSLTAFFNVGYFKDFVYEQPSWDLRSFSFARDVKAAEAKTGDALDAVDTNLKPFTQRGGKLILYHGWADPAIPAEGTIDYYNGVVGVLGERATTDALRLYMVPGMQHCAGGPGAVSFGQQPEAVRGDAQHDIFTALEQWVESGKAPESLITRGNGMSRPLCVYPQVAKYDGGDTRDAKSLSCVAGPR